MKKIAIWTFTYLSQKTFQNKADLSPDLCVCVCVFIFAPVHVHT